MLMDEACLALLTESARIGTMHTSSGGRNGWEKGGGGEFGATCAFVEQNVVRLDVSMDHVVPVQILQPCYTLLHHLPGFSFAHPKQIVAMPYDAPVAQRERWLGTQRLSIAAARARVRMRR